MWRAFSLRGERPRQPEVCVASPWVRRAFSLCSPRARRWLGLRKSLDRNRGPVCSVGLGDFSGAEIAPFPYPLPPTSSRDGPALLWSFSVPLFCEPPAVFGMINFSLLSHSLKKLPLAALRAFRPVLTLSNAARSSPFRPPLAGGGCRHLGYFSAGSCF